MKDFADLFAELDATTSTQAKVAALVRHFRHAGPADAAWAAWRSRAAIGPSQRVSSAADGPMAVSAW